MEPATQRLSDARAVLRALRAELAASMAAEACLRQTALLERAPDGRRGATPLAEALAQATDLRAGREELRVRALWIAVAGAEASVRSAEVDHSVCSALGAWSGTVRG